MPIVSPKTPEFNFSMNNKQSDPPLITEHIRVLALQTFPGGSAGPQAPLIFTAEPELHCDHENTAEC